MLHLLQNWKNLVKITQILFGILLLGGVILWSQGGFAQTSPHSHQLLQEWQEQIERQEQQVQQKRDRLSSVETSAQRYRDTLERNVQLMDLQLQYYEQAVRQANRRLEELETKLAKERKNYIPKLEATVARLRFLQRQSVSSQGWQFLLRSEDLNEFFDRRARLRQVYEADRQRLAALQKTANKIKEQKNAIETQNEEITQLQSQILSQKEDIETQLAIQEELLSQIKGDRATLTAVQEKLDTDSQGIMDLIQKRGSGGNLFILGGTGQFILPHNAKITSPFGWRTHPVLGGKRLHSGIDFGGSYGSPIVAADDGTVIFAGWYGGYGKTVIIDHGRGMTTLYGHTSQIDVQEGQPVQQGDKIAAVGSSGLSTGPHLHFEIRQKGEPVDPIKYLGLAD